MNEHVFWERKATFLYSTVLGLLSTPYERARFLGTKSNFFVYYYIGLTKYPPMNEHVFWERKATFLYSTVLGLLSTPL